MITAFLCLLINIKILFLSNTQPSQPELPLGIGTELIDTPSKTHHFLGAHHLPSLSMNM